MYGPMIENRPGLRECPRCTCRAVAASQVPALNKERRDMTHARDEAFLLSDHGQTYISRITHARAKGDRHEKKNIYNLQERAYVSRAESRAGQGKAAKELEKIRPA